MRQNGRRSKKKWFVHLTQENGGTDFDENSFLLYERKKVYNNIKLNVYNNIRLNGERSKSYLIA